MEHKRIEDVAVARGERLRYLREQRSLSQYDLAQATNIRPETISRLERGTQKMSLESAEGLAAFFAVSLEWLLYGETSARESRVEPVEDEELTTAERALRALGQDEATTAKLRRRLAEAQFSTGHRLSTIVNFLEDELATLRAAERGDARGAAEPAPEPPPNMARLPPKKRKR